jgi:predicted nucleotidyltransferase
MNAFSMAFSFQPQHEKTSAQPRFCHKAPGSSRRIITKVPRFPVAFRPSCRQRAFATAQSMSVRACPGWRKNPVCRPPFVVNLSLYCQAIRKSSTDEIIVSDIPQQIAPVLRARPEIRLAILFGSAAGKARLASDVDLAVDLGAPMSAVTKTELIDELAGRVASRIIRYTFLAGRCFFAREVLRELVNSLKARKGRE